MSWKTAENTNIHLMPEEADGVISAAPPLQPLRWVSNTLEGANETIQNDTKLPGRNPSRNFKGTDSNAGDLVVNFAPLEHDSLLEAVLCSENGFVLDDALSSPAHLVYNLIPGNKQRTFALLKEFTQEPKLYQFFKGLQFNTLNISFTIGALVKLTFGLMGKNNPELEEFPPVEFTNKLPTFKTEEFITLAGSWKFKGPNDAVPVEYIDGVDITLVITNNMAELRGLFQTEAIDKTLGMLNITGTINEYVKDGKLYNLAKQGEGGELHITVYNEKEGVEYEFVLNISFDNSTLSGDTQLQYALPFQTFGEDRFKIIKRVIENPGTPPQPGIQGTVEIIGTPTVGEDLTASVSGEAGNAAAGELHYKWRSRTASGNFEVILGAVYDSYTLTADDEDKYFEVIITRDGYSGQLVSNTVGPVVEA